MTDIAPLCHIESSQLLLIDIQERLAAAMPHEVMARVGHNSAILAEAAQLLEVPIRVSRQYPKGLGDIVDNLKLITKDVDLLYDKTSFSCCSDSDFAEQLEEQSRGQFIIAGMESHVCVLQTALELQEQGFQVFVVEDAVCSRRKLNHHNALARLRQAGVIITSTESVVLEWLRDASHPHFKTLSALIK